MTLHRRRHINRAKVDPSTLTTEEKYNKILESCARIKKSKHKITLNRLRLETAWSSWGIWPVLSEMIKDGTLIYEGARGSFDDAQFSTPRRRTPLNKFQSNLDQHNISCIEDVLKETLGDEYIEPSSSIGQDQLSMVLQEVFGENFVV